MLDSDNGSPGTTFSHHSISPKKIISSTPGFKVLWPTKTTVTEEHKQEGL